MKELKCTECGGNLYISVCFDRKDEQAYKYCSGYKDRSDYGQLVLLTCYDCGEVFEICRAPVTADISEIRGMYDLVSMQLSEEYNHNCVLAANRSCFTDGLVIKVDDLDSESIQYWIDSSRKRGYIVNNTSLCEYPF